MQEKAPLSHGFGISQEDSSNDYSVELRFQVLWVVVFADGDERKRIWERKNWGRSQKRLSSLAPTATNNTPRYENVAMKKKERRDWIGGKRRKRNNKKPIKRDKKKKKGTTLEWKIIDPQWIPVTGFSQPWSCLIWSLLIDTTDTATTITVQSNIAANAKQRQ